MDHDQFEAPRIEVSIPRLMTRMITTNRVDKIHVSQQLLSPCGVMDYTSRTLARIEVIHIFHKSDKLGFQFSAKLSAGLREIREWAGGRGSSTVVCTSVLAAESIRILARIGFSKACEGVTSTRGIDALGCWSDTV